MQDLLGGELTKRVPTTTQHGVGHKAKTKISVNQYFVFVVVFIEKEYCAFWSSPMECGFRSEM